MDLTNTVHQHSTSTSELIMSRLTSDLYAVAVLYPSETPSLKLKRACQAQGHDASLTTDGAWHNLPSWAAAWATSSDWLACAEKRRHTTKRKGPMDDQGCPTLKRRTHGNDILNEAQILPYNLVGHRNIRHTALRGPRCPKHQCPRRVVSRNVGRPRKAP